MNSSSNNKLFGTDGVRGIANIEPVTSEMALKLGRAAAHWFKQHEERRHKIVIGKDTRLSGYMLENAMVAGITSMGVDALVIGPLPTPGVAYITRSLRCDAGIVLTASHNPYEDNGIKFFRSDGYKLEDQIETQIEDIVFSGKIDSIRPIAGQIGKAFRIDDALGRYIEFVKASFPKNLSLEGMRIVVDTANGATYKSSPCILRELGAEVITLHNQPNGTNINAQCGSTHPEVICEAVKRHQADIGISHDGDGDRLILSDETGSIVDGDIVLAIAGLDLLKKSALAKKTLVVTVMSNLALDSIFEKAGGKVIRTVVGDRYVIEKMVELNTNLGGEQSGHIIFRDFTTTGDGILSALQILRIMKSSNARLSQLRQCIRLYPQAQRNLKVKSKPPLEEVPGLMEEVRKTEKALGTRGRVLLRYSGTEPKIRLLIEGESQPEIEQYAENISLIIKGTLVE